MEQQALAMTAPKCPTCQSAAKRFGRHRNGLQRFRCLSCRKTFTDAHSPPYPLNELLQPED